MKVRATNKNENNVQMAKKKKKKSHMAEGIIIPFFPLLKLSSNIAPKLLLLPVV